MVASSSLEVGATLVRTTQTHLLTDGFKMYGQGHIPPPRATPLGPAHANAKPVLHSCPTCGSRLISLLATTPIKCGDPVLVADSQGLATSSRPAYIVQFDGSCRGAGSPQPAAGAGIYMVEVKDGYITDLWAQAIPAPEAKDAAMAEVCGAQKAVEALAQLQREHANPQEYDWLIQGDNAAVIGALKGIHRFKRNNMWAPIHAVQRLLACCDPPFQLEYIMREVNKIADYLAGVASAALLTYILTPAGPPPGQTTVESHPLHEEHEGRILFSWPPTGHNAVLTGPTLPHEGANALVELPIGLWAARDRNQLDAIRALCQLRPFTIQYLRTADTGWAPATSHSVSALSLPTLFSLYPSLDLLEDPLHRHQRLLRWPSLPEGTAHVLQTVTTQLAQAGFAPLQALLLTEAWLFSPALRYRWASTLPFTCWAAAARQTILRLISHEEDDEQVVFKQLHEQWITYYLDKTCTLIDTTQREGLIASSLGFLVPRSSSTVSEYFAFHCTHAATFWRAPFGTWAPPYWYSWVSTGEVSDTINVKRSRPAVLTASSHKNRNAFLRRKLRYS